MSPSRGTGQGLRGPIRGFPPSPRQADPVYPPGQFSLWNRASARATWLGLADPEGSAGEADAEPGYSAFAVSDPSADATVTQTWAVIEDDLRSDERPPRDTNRDWGSHTGDTGPAPRRTDARQVASGRPASPTRPDAPGRAPGGDRRDVRATRPAQPAAMAAAATAPVTTAAAPTAAEPMSPGTAEPESIIPRATDHRARTPVTQRTPRSPDEDGGGRRSRGASRGRAEPTGRRKGKGKGKGKRRGVMMAGLLLVPVLIVLLVAAGYVYFSAKPAPTAGHTAAPRHTAAAPVSPAPTLGRWKHIESRAKDPTPLTVAELFPQQFSINGVAGVRTIDKTSTNCPREVFGSALAAAVRKAGCTQVLRASYLSTDHKFMATVGVLNLSDVAAAKDVGKASGSAEFIKQLPAAHGPTRKLSKGTGIEEAAVKGHYLILIWTEFTNLQAPSGKSQRNKLEAFSADLIAGTANVSLSHRMVTGQP